MRFYFLSIILALYVSPALAQLKLSMGSHFLTGQNIKKVEVSPEDYTVWALSQDHKVYYKKAASSNFDLYTPVSGMPVNDVAGYTIDDMYFLVGSTIVNVRNGVATQLTIPDPLVTQINGIAIVDPAYNASQDFYDLKGGCLMITTNNNVYLLPKGNTSFQQFTGGRPIPAPSNNWDYIRSSFKGISMRNNIPNNYCTTTADYSFYNIFDFTLFVNGDMKFTPDKGQFTASIMPFHSFDLFSGGLYGSNYRNYIVWSSTTGLYAFYSLSCNLTQLVHPITEQVNAISEAMALTEIAPQHYLIAGTNTGLQYTPNTIFPTETQAVNLTAIKFTSFPDFPVVKVNDVLIDSRKDPEPSYFTFVCDNTAYIATADGVYQVYLSYNQQGYDNLRVQNFATYGGTTPTYNADGNAVFNRCDNAQPVNLQLLNHPNTSLLIKWFKDGVELPDRLNKQAVTFTDAGIYHAEVISTCEGVAIKSVNFIIQSASDPQITFNYPDKISICEGTSYTLATGFLPGYTYRWFKDDVQISGATSSDYTATQPGQYHVEVSNCGTFYKQSKTITISRTDIPMPVITTDKVSYCSGETAILSVTNDNQYNMKWYLNGNELIANANQNTISVTTPGAYNAIFLSNECQKLSSVYNLSFNQPIKFNILKSKSGSICYGDRVTLSTSVTADSYLWSTGETTPQISVSKSGQYTVKLKSAGSCETTQAVDVTVLPQVQLAAIENKTICTMAGDKLRIEAQSGFVNYQWNGRSTTVNYLDVTSPGTYLLIATTADGCMAQTTFEVTPWCEQVIIPNTFTPNGDGINDLWEIGGVEHDGTATVRIYNRYGNILVNKQANGFKWDGKFNGKDLPSGTYYYEIKTKKSATPLSGWVAIIR
ncbi:T9SS type B sorting domain-containing protein [Mucilaginibacter paludis]|uniref:Ig-like domain-containing protein n=1 Tax=Mucilaginibacter paludis DSM 18603 TaxID=714943 RepID=H1YE10_9SPHI|nr:T9SS type B sorting domain-containing protein [Mucilaginibacter paludis]EHQ25188.1 hypothetical protein Mucpa_1014 [Mucilaginibacter paludis DSM 18603]